VSGSRGRSTISFGGQELGKRKQRSAGDVDSRKRGKVRFGRKGKTPCFAKVQRKKEKGRRKRPYCPRRGEKLLSQSGYFTFEELSMKKPLLYKSKEIGGRDAFVFLFKERGGGEKGKQKFICWAKKLFFLF